MQQVKILEGGVNQEKEINKWLVENPNIKVDSITIIPLLDRYPDGAICNQWFETIILYEEG